MLTFIAYLFQEGTGLMHRRFVTEAVMLASYGQLLFPSRTVEYVIPYSTVAELYEMAQSQDPIMQNPDDETHVRQKVAELIEFFENPLNRKKVERAHLAPWRKSPPIPVNEQVSLTVINAVDNAQYGEMFDPIETELLLTSIKEGIPILTDQFEFIDRAIEAEIPVRIFDIDDFDFAVEEDIEENI